MAKLEVKFNATNEVLPVRLGEAINQTVINRNHDALYNKDLANQHPIEAITGLREALNGLDTRMSDLESSVGSATVEVSTRSELPNRGVSSTVYIVTGENATYRWDEENSKFYCIGRDYEELEIIICGGNA